jgi:hypothetical protein
VRPLLATALVLAAGLLGARSVAAERYSVQRGETLEHVAIAHGCSVEALLRANNLRTTLVRPGTSITIPDCSIRARAQTRTRTASSQSSVPTTDTEKARAALSVIDGATWTAATAESDSLLDARPPSTSGVTIGERLPGDEGYRIRRPTRAYGASHVIDHLRSAVAVVRALYPDVHTLAIGDLSAEHGGKLDNHVSHQTGLDVDVGFFFKRVPAGYPDRFAPADANLDLEATWALVTAFARTAPLDDGVSIIFLDYAVQRRLYDWAHKRGTPTEDLEALLQYPRGKDSYSGLIRHWPNHADHLHVRFKRL